MDNSRQAISVENLHKSFGTNEVLKGVNLSASQGEVISILGSSGSGKSTLLRCINLLEIPNSGILRVSGEEVLMKKNRRGENQPVDKRQVERIRAKLAMVFQQFNLWSHMTILDNVSEAPIHVLKKGRKTAREKAVHYLEKVGIGDKLDAYPAQLSGGQQQRTAVARAIHAISEDGTYVDRHVARVACQTCHIPTYAKDAADTSASEATEVYRTWLETHSDAPPFHPVMAKANELMPEYLFWNRFSNNYLLGDVAVLDSDTGRYPTSRPLGDVGDADSKLYAFKYKTAQQPMANSTGQLIALDTSVFFATGDAAAATEQGLANMGLGADEPYSWVETDTYQMLNHEVSPSGQALECGDCHGSTARMDLQGDLGYGLKASLDDLCVQCHGYKSSKGFTENHDKHVKDKKYDCSWCHQFSRPELGLEMP